MNFHDELNPKLWENDELKPEVSEKLKEIANAFIEYLEIPDEAVKDIIITGSSANYNYTEHSDLDLHLKVDYELVHENCPIVEGYLWAMKASFNKDHDISIYGVPVELYAEDTKADAVSNGVYSLQQDKWLKFPEKIKPTTNDAAVQAKYLEIKEMCEKVEDSEVAQDLLDKIYQMRKAGLADGGEFSTENMAFKLLRNDGIIEKLKDMKKEQFDKELTLESLENNQGHICIGLKRDGSNYGFLKVDNDKLFSDHNLNSCTQFKSLEDVKKYTKRLERAGFNVSYFGTGKFSHIKNEGIMEYTNTQELFKLDHQIASIENELIKVRDEINKGEKGKVAKEEPFKKRDELTKKLDGLKARRNKVLGEAEEVENTEEDNLDADFEQALDGNYLEYVAPFFHGFYESVYTDALYQDDAYHLFNEPNNVPENILEFCMNIATMPDGFEDAVGAVYLTEIDDAMKEVIPSWGESKYVETDSPKEYNYTTDRIVGKIKYTEELNNEIRAYLEANKEQFTKWIKDNHSSYDGFYSFYSNDSEEWLNADEWDYNEIGSIIGFILNNNYGDEIGDDLNYRTYEYCSGNGILWPDVDINEVIKEFNFNVEPKTLGDLEQYKYDEEKDMYIYQVQDPNQTKLDLKFESLSSIKKELEESLKLATNEVSNAIINRVGQKRIDNQFKAKKELEDNRFNYNPNSQDVINADKKYKLAREKSIKHTLLKNRRKDG
jgi:hypothetical protein